MSSNHCRSSPGLGIVGIFFFIWNNAGAEECHLNVVLLCLAFMVNAACYGFSVMDLPQLCLLVLFGEFVKPWNKGSDVQTQECGDRTNKTSL